MFKLFLYALFLRMRHILVFLLIVQITSFSVQAAEQEIPTKNEEIASEDAMNEESDMEALMGILDEETEIATKSKMNADYVPGMVTVLNGEDLELLGIHTVWEALSLAPGIQLVRDNDGSPMVTVRGLQFPFNSGNIKVMVNSIGMSREDSGINTSALLLPVEQVERIEFIRGPGSSLYGSFAFMGVVNIITRAAGKGVFSRVKEGDTFAGGGHYAYSDPDSPLRFSANIAGLNSDETYAPVSVKAGEERQSGIFSLNYKESSLTAQIVNDYSDELEKDERNSVIAFKQGVTFSPSLDADFNISYLHNDVGIADSGFKGDLIEGSADFSWNGMEGHKWLFGMSLIQSSVEEATLSTPAAPGLTTQIKDITWRDYGFSVQNQFNLIEGLTLTSGLRFDYRDDIKETRPTPRFSAVWQVSDPHIFKAQYSQGFRSPTFFELYGLGGSNLYLDSEIVKSTELGYVYKKTKAVGRVTLFHSKFEDMIFPNPPPVGFDNNREALAQGVEFEWEQRLTGKLKWSANLSYVDTWDTRGVSGEKQESISSADWLGNISLWARPAQNLLFTGHWYHVGTRSTETNDAVGFDTVDLSVNVFHFFTKGLTFRAGVKNIFDDEVSYLIMRPVGMETFDYPGRKSWAQLSKEF